MSFNEGVAKGHLVGLRVATPVGADVSKRRVIYTPGYIRADGKAIGQLCKVTCFLNHGKKANDKASLFTIHAWNKLADVFARGMSPGKELYAEVRMESYYSNVYNKGGQQLMNQDGTAVQVLKHTFTVTDFKFGDDSRKFINDEILNGKRPENWNDGAEGTAAWRAVLDRRNAAQYVDGRETFGYARVIKKTTTNTATGTGLPADVQTAADQAGQLKESFGNMGEGQQALGQDDDPF